MYIGEFKNIKNDDFTVGIFDPKVTTRTTKLTMGTPAFTVSLEGAGDNIYKPLKCSSATIKIVTKNYLFDLYSSEAHKNKVILKQGNRTLWVGFVSPNAYSQPYENPYDEIDIECIDALSTLQYYDYETMEVGKKGVINFVTLINHILSKCEAYSNFYISNSIKAKKEDQFCLAHYCSISESNFFDEDDDEPLTYKEVLEDICTFLNLTCIAIGNDVFFINYDEIKNGVQHYSAYTINGDMSRPTTIDVSMPIIIDKTLYRENGTNLSLDKTYNKISVVSQHNIIDNLLPDIFDDKLLKQRILPTQQHVIENKRIQLWMDGDHPSEDEKKQREKEARYQWFNHKYYTGYFYDKNFHLYEPRTPLVVEDVAGSICGVICKHSTTEFKQATQFDEPESKLNLTTYLLLAQQNYIGNELPLYTIKLQNKNGANAGVSDDCRLVLSGKVKFYIGEQYTDLPFTGKSKGISGGVWGCSHRLVLPMRIKLDGKYFNSTTRTWQDEPITAYIPLYSSDISDDDKITNCIDIDLNIKNMISWTDDYKDANGFYIPMPNKITDISDFEITFMTYLRPFIQYSHANYVPKYIFIKDFKADIIRKTVFKRNDNIFSPTYEAENNEENNDTDTVYENVINENYVEEGDEIQFNICTDDGKANAYSTVFLNYGNGYEMLDKTFDFSTKQNLRQEEQLIYRLVNQYKEPSIKISSTLVSNISPLSICEDVTINEKLFIVDSQEIDYEFDKQEINLIEKK